ncbi:MAG: hypothetical protein ICV68_01595 [Pyrinomonadaceae bacterium]|nr:hypothetical protein [Pyrinomonadaceae bacterium]
MKTTLYLIEPISFQPFLARILSLLGRFILRQQMTSQDFANGRTRPLTS